MKHTVPDYLLSRELLCFVRDHRPSVDEFVTRFGGPHDQTFHVLRKEGVIVIEGGRVTLDPAHLTTDGRHFVWGVKLYSLERDEVQVVCWGPRD